MATTSIPTTPHTAETLRVPLEGVTEAEIRIGFGGGELAIHQAEPGILLAGEFEEGVQQRTGEPGKIQIEPRRVAQPFVACAPLHWDVGVTGEIPVRLRLDTGANRSRIDLSGVRVRTLELHTGASETTLRMPTSGRTQARIECGFAMVTVEVPQGVAARVQGAMGLGALEVDAVRFPRSGETWRSEDFESAVDRIDIVVSGGFGTVRIV